jgi:hypothetical protein
MDYDAHLTPRRGDTVYRPSGLVAIVGCATLLRTWREDSSLRHDTADTLAIFRRQRTIILALAAMLLAAVILVFAVSHVVMD